MSVEENKALVLRFYDEVFNKRNLALADEMVAAEYKNHSALPGTPRGPEGIKRVVNMLAGIFPDCVHTIEDIFGEGDKIVWRGTLSGTHLGSFLGNPPTGKTFVQKQMHIIRLVDGKQVEHWSMRDELGLQQQLGFSFAPPPARV
jgi:predicted ester cyclase